VIAIIDYGLGNIRAFANIFKRLNIPVVIATVSSQLAVATKFILPGVGAFDHAMERLEASGMHGALNDAVVGERRPVLGVCVGMQMLAQSSEEGQRAGLGWVSGSVRRLRFPDVSRQRILPHMGWNTVRPVAGNPLFAGLGTDALFYFLHSYYFECHDPQNAIASADYAGAFTCAIQSGNIYGVQFHPEKSHHNGIQLLQNFARL
jgi:glutamine amidotransferase